MLPYDVYIPCSSSTDALPHPHGQSRQAPEIEIRALIRHVLAARNAMDFHLGMELQVIEQLRGNEEILARSFRTGNVDHAFVHHALVARVHTLVDLVDNTEWRAGKTLESHEVEDRRNGTFST